MLLIITPTPTPVSAQWVVNVDFGFVHIDIVSLSLLSCYLLIVAAVYHVFVLGVFISVCLFMCLCCCCCRRHSTNTRSCLVRLFQSTLFTGPINLTYACWNACIWHSAIFSSRPSLLAYSLLVLFVPLLAGRNQFEIQTLHLVAFPFCCPFSVGGGFLCCYCPCCHCCHRMTPYSHHRCIVYFLWLLLHALLGFFYFCSSRLLVSSSSFCPSRLLVFLLPIVWLLVMELKLQNSEMKIELLVCRTRTINTRYGRAFVWSTRTCIWYLCKSVRRLCSSFRCARASSWQKEFPRTATLFHLIEHHVQTLVTECAPHPIQHLLQLEEGHPQQLQQPRQCHIVVASL